jgi:hypothetical protein
MLDSPVVPPGVSGIDHANLNQMFTDLDQKIEELAKKVMQHRTSLAPQYTRNTKDVKCTICTEMVGEKKLQCLRECTQPIVKHEDLLLLEPEFPIDVQRIKTDPELRRQFERHQFIPSSIESTDVEASLIADIYAMPIATAVLPEASWSRSLEVIREKRFAGQLAALIRNWRDRERSYSEESKQELANKISRHDNENELLDAASELA